MRLREGGQEASFVTSDENAKCVAEEDLKGRPLQENRGAKSAHGPGRVLVVKLISTGGTMHACKGGQPASVMALRQSEVSALLNCEGLAAPLRGSA